MRKIATILVLLFVLVQVAPAVCTILSLQTGFFIVDEEQNPEKTEKKDSKEVKKIMALTNSREEYSVKIQTPFLNSEKITLSPYLEKLTPPPDFI